MADPIRLASNTRWFDGRTIDGRPVEPMRLPSGQGVWSRLASFRRARRCDAVVFNVETAELFAFCALARVLGRGRCRIVAVDLILEPPSGWRGALRVAVKRWLLRTVDLFVWYYPRTEAVRRIYGIPAERVVYVPFKVNSLDRVLGMTPADEGFVLACGRSKRDYRTFCAAMRELDVPGVILAHVGRETEAHGADIDLDAVPPNVRIVSDDGSADSWLDWMARATLVVLPILPGTLAPSGIGAYLGAMALGKCVVITESPATMDILSAEQAVIVPPRDAPALRAAIARALGDAPFRSRIAAAGKAYAMSLGDESRLAADIAVAVGRVIASR